MAFLVGGSGDRAWVAQERAAGHRIIRRADYLGWAGLLRHPAGTLRLGASAWLALTGVAHLGAAEWLHDAAASGLRTVVCETNLLERLAPACRYVYTNQYGLVPRWRNALLRRHGAESWWFAYSNGGAFLYQDNQPFASGRDFGGRIRYWAYDNMDHFVSPCPQLIECYQRHRQRVRPEHYHDVGNIWSERVLATAAAMDRQALLAEWFGPTAGDRKVMAWFDTSFVEARHSPSTFTEAIQWYGDILRLVREREDVLMVIKPSKDEAYYVDEGPGQLWSVPALGRELLRVWQALRVHPRVRFLENSADAAVVIATSDLTVTFCYSSVSAEALGARKRAIWYEPGQRWRETLLGKEPLLVAHGYEELRRVVETLLVRMSDAEYDAYLKETVRGLVEEFLDGRGLSRFRALLAGKEPAELSGTAEGSEASYVPLTSERA